MQGGCSLLAAPRPSTPRAAVAHQLPSAAGWCRGGGSCAREQCPHATHRRGRANDGIEQWACRKVWSGSHTAPTHQFGRVMRPDGRLQRVPPRLGGRAQLEVQGGERGEGGEILKRHVRHVPAVVQVEGGERGQASHRAQTVSRQALYPAVTNLQCLAARVVDSPPPPTHASHSARVTPFHSRPEPSAAAPLAATLTAPPLAACPWRRPGEVLALEEP